MSIGIGDTLRDAREAQGRTREDVAAALRLRTGQVVALEEERFGEFGGDVYARGFLKSCAVELGLDPQPLLDAYRREISGGDPFATTPLVAPGSGPGVPIRRSAPPGWIAWVLVGVIVLVGLAFIGQLAGSRAPEQASSDPTEAPVAPADDGDAAPDGQDEDDGSGPDAEGSDDDADDDAGDGDDDGEEPAAEGVELFLALESESWMRVVVDGTVVFEQVAEQGETLRFPGEESVTVRFGNAGGVRVEFNGEDLGTPGPSGSVVEVEYTPDGQDEI